MSESFLDQYSRVDRVMDLNRDWRGITMQDCTCVGSCRGKHGLGADWKCVLEKEPDTWREDAAELLRQLNDLCSRHEAPPYYREDRLNLGEFITARQYLSLLDHAEDVLKHYHELLDFAEGTAGDNKGRPWEWIEKAKTVVYKAEGNT